MKLQKSTLGLLITAFILGGVVYFHEVQRNSQPEDVQSQQPKIFNFKAEDIQRLTVAISGKTLQFDRTNNPKQAWQMKQPESTAANDAVVLFLVNLLVGENSDRSFQISPTQQKDYGFDQPLGILTIQLKDNSTHQLILGKPDFQDQYLYAKIDPSHSPNPEITIHLVTKAFQSALDRQPNEWKLTPQPVSPSSPKQTP